MTSIDTRRAAPRLPSTPAASTPAASAAPASEASAKPELKRAPNLESKVKEDVSRFESKLERAKPLSAAPQTGASAPAPSGLGKLKDSLKNWHEGAQKSAEDKAGAGYGAGSKVQSGLGVASGINGMVSGGKQLVQGIKDHNANEALGGAILAGHGALGTAKSGLNLAAGIASGKNLKGLEGALGKELKGLEGAAGKALGGEKVGKDISKAAAEAAHLGKNVEQSVLGAAAASKGLGAKVGVGIKQGLADMLKQGAGTKGMKDLAGKLEGSVAKAGKEALGGAGKAEEVLKGAGEVAKGAEGVAKGAGVLGKAAGRFVPGLDIGIAALDTANAAKTIADPKSSTADKVTTGITAAGSIAAATNIPIVAQVGAGVSMASSLVGEAIDHKDDIKKFVQDPGGTIKDAASKVGDFFSSL